MPLDILRAMSYSWLKFLHIAAVLALLGTHGVSMTVLYAIRRERDRAKIMTMMALSGQATIPMYVSIGAVVLFGACCGTRSTASARPGSGRRSCC